ncbi:MAG: flagellar hook-length control protein FliK [bacterium]|nr:flagellar hook-length control protein FliK [bacterium]
MQIGTFIGQYNKSAAPVNNTPIPGSGVTPLTASLKELLPGSIFEGNISYVKGSQVILSLENGQNVHAKLDGALKLQQGQSMFFQVRSNDGKTISIRPYTDGNMSNPTLVRALEAAGMPASERNLAMVNAMMKEQMPIDADSLMAMHRVLIGNETISVDTLVSMSKLSIPITPQMAAQFENYQNDKHALLSQMKDFLQELPVFFSEGGLTIADQINNHAQMIELLTAYSAQSDGQPELQQKDTPVSELLSANPDMIRTDSAVQPERVIEEAILEETDDLLEQLHVLDAVEEHDYLPSQLGHLADLEQLADFADVLRGIGDLVENEQIFDNEGELNKKLTAKELLVVISNELLSHTAELEQEDLKELFSHKVFLRMLSQIAEEQWLLEPEQLKEKDKLTQLYERLDRQMEQMSKLLKVIGHESGALHKTIDQIQGNIEFMNEVNQIYNYVQLPLKLNGQNANGDLYVYTNKRKGMEEDGELSAFLHLDMEHLGSTDVLVKLKGKSIDTGFTISDDKSMALVEKYLPVLEEKLSSMGYQCSLYVKEDGQKLDFVQDFLKKDIPGHGDGIVHRYSFDVRA